MFARSFVAEVKLQAVNTVMFCVYIRQQNFFMSLGTSKNSRLLAAGGKTPALKDLPLTLLTWRLGNTCSS